VLAVSSWRSLEDMQRYLDQPVTSAFYQSLPALLMGMPSVRTFEVISPDGAGAPGWGST
jgi:quinol monooxygenase YgiN